MRNSPFVNGVPGRWAVLGAAASFFCGVLLARQWYSDSQRQLGSLVSYQIDNPFQIQIVQESGASSPAELIEQPEKVEAILGVLKSKVQRADSVHRWPRAGDHIVLSQTSKDGTGWDIVAYRRGLCEIKLNGKSVSRVEGVWAFELLSCVAD